MSSSSTTNRVIISCVALLVVACLCTCLVGLGGLAIWFLTANKNLISDTSPTTPRTIRPTVTIAAPNTTNSPVDISTQMNQIEQNIISIRGLEPTESTPRSLLTPEELRQHVTDDMLKDYTQEEARDDVIVLNAFGLLPAQYDLYNLYIELLSEQIAGFYDNEKKAMYVVQGEDFLGPQRMTYAHEYVHALQDQVYDIEKGLNYSDEICEKESEHCAAVQALLEGDASLAETTWLTNYSTQEDKTEIMQFYATYQSPVYDSAPEFLKKDFLFPYQQGLEFVQALYDDGGWRAVDQAYQNLPDSTEQILHPENYPEDQPVNVTLSDLNTVLGEGWREVERGAMGEWYTQLILAAGWDEKARLAESKASEAAAGWGGDAYVVYYQDQTQSTVMVLSYEWDTAADASQFNNTFMEYASARFGDSQQSSDHAFWQTPQGYTAIYHTDRRTTWIFAPDAKLADAVWQELHVP